MEPVEVGAHYGRSNLENIYLQFREGVIDESALNAYGWRGSLMYETEAFAGWWQEGGRLRFDPRFVEAFEADRPILRGTGVGDVP